MLNDNHSLMTPKCCPSITRALLVSCLCLLISILSFVFTVLAEAQEATSALEYLGTGVAPNIIRWSGSLPEYAGKTITVRFSLYRDQTGGNALWNESQQIKVQNNGRYQVLLGATYPEGISKALFIHDEAHWISVQPIDRQLTTNDESNSETAMMPYSTRNMLTPTPYAFKSMDSASLGGYPASEYVTHHDLELAVTQSLADTLNELEKLPHLFPTVNRFPILNINTVPPNPGSVPVWTSSSTLGNSLISELGSSIGIANLRPATTLDVNGTSTFRGEVNIPGSAASAENGINSPLLQLQASTYSSTSKIAVSQNFAWESLSAGNNTPNPTANLALLFGAGDSDLKPTGLSIAPNGLITFAPGQTFPTANGTNASSGSGTVNPGNAGQIASYTGNGTAIGGVSAVPVTAGGTGAISAAEALANLGAMPLIGGTFTGALNGISASFSGAVSAGTTLPSGAPSGTVGAAQIYSPKGEFDPYAFGAKGDGTTDDTTAIQNALNAAGVLGSAVVRLHPGKYKTSATLNLPSGVLLLGSGESFCESPAGTCISNTSGSPAIKVDASVAGEGYGFEIADLDIYGSATTDTCISLIGNSSTSPRTYQIHNVTCQHFGAQGLYINGTSYGVIDRFTANCYIGGTIGIDIEPGALYQEVTYFRDINTQNCSTYGLNVMAGDLLYFDHADLNQSPTNLHIGGGFSNNFINLNSAWSTLYGVYIDGSTGNTYENHFMNVRIGITGASTSERAFYAYGSGKRAEADVTGYTVQVFGSTQPTYMFQDSGNGILQMRFPNDPSAYTYSFGGSSLSNFQHFSYFPVGIQTTSITTSGISFFNKIHDSQLTVNGAILQDSGGYIGETFTLPNGIVATTQSAGDNSTKVATTAYVASPGAIVPTSVSASGNIAGGSFSVTGAPAGAYAKADGSGYGMPGALNLSQTYISVSAATLAAGQCASATGTVSDPNPSTAKVVIVTPWGSDNDPGGAFTLKGFISATSSNTDTVTVEICAPNGGTLGGYSYQVRVIN